MTELASGRATWRQPLTAWGLVATFIVTGGLAVQAATYYVAPTGDDSNPGTSAQPFASLRHAVAAARALPRQEVRRILLRSGTYYNTGVTLGAADSGLTLAAAPGEHPLLLGGVHLRGWHRTGEHFWAAHLPAFPAETGAGATMTNWQIRLLVVNGRLCPRARYPAKGTLPHESTFNVPWMSSTGGGWKRRPTHAELTTLRYKPGLLDPQLEVRNAEITVFHMWDESTVGVVSNDPVHGILRLSPPCGHPPGAFGVKQFVLWNTREGMTHPGEWYFDRVHQRVVYWPLPGEDMRHAVVWAPTRTCILALRGRANDPVRHVTVRGLAFSVTTVPLRAGGFAAAAYGGAISLAHTADCRLESLTITRVAGQAIKAARNVVDTHVERCEITDCGAGGIYVGGTRSVIRNNRVHGIGRAYPSAVGIYEGGHDCVVSHNAVFDCPYSAINYGGQRNLIADNLIYDCMKVLHDGAAIYIFAGKGCIVRGNVTHDLVDHGGYPVCAYYLDERCTHCVVERNLALRVTWPTHNHMATNNVIRQNVFIAKGNMKLTFPRSTDYTFAQNVLFATGQIRIEGVNAVTNWSHNLMFSGTGKIEQVTLRRYSAVGSRAGAPAGTLVANPRFVDWQKGDVRFQADSPARQLGLPPLDFTHAGPMR